MRSLGAVVVSIRKAQQHTLSTALYVHVSGRSLSPRIPRIRSCAASASPPSTWHARIAALYASRLGAWPLRRIRGNNASAASF